MRSHIRPVATVGAVLSLSLVLASCSGSDPSTDSSGTEQSSSGQMTQESSEGSGEMMGASMVAPDSSGDPFADAHAAAKHMRMTASTLAGGFVKAADLEGDSASAAADLRATLTALLQEHVYLAGFAVATAYTAEGGTDSEEFKAAAAALDKNSVALSEAIGSLAGQEKADAFLKLWREHIGYFVDYAVAVKSGDDGAKQEALDNLAGYTTEAGSFFETISKGELPADAIAQSLEKHIATLTAAIDALAAGSPDAPEKLQMAAHHIVEGATVIAGGLDKAADLEGDPADPASTLRTNLTALLQEHVYLASLAVFTAYTAEGGAESEAFKAAAATLDENSVALSEAIGSLAGQEKADAFLDLWREHIGYFVDYAVALAGDDSEAAEKALMNLDDYRTTAGKFFEEISGGELPADAIAKGLATHVQTLAGAIKSLATTLT